MYNELTLSNNVRHSVAPTVNNIRIKCAGKWSKSGELLHKCYLVFSIRAIRERSTDGLQQITLYHKASLSLDGMPSAFADLIFHFGPYSFDPRPSICLE